MNVGPPRPMSNGAQVLLEDAQQLATLLVQRAHAAALALDRIPPDEGWQPLQLRPGVLAWAQAASPPPPAASTPPPIS